MSNRIAVVGTGMIGSALVCALQKQLPKAELVWIGASIDPPNPLANTDSRVIACSPGSRKLLEELGVWSLLPENRMTSYSRVCVWDYEGTGRVDFSGEEIFPEDIKNKNLGYILENSLILQALHRQIDLQSNQPERHVPDIIERFEQVPQAGVKLFLASGTELEVDMICAADGANSSLRDWLKIPTQSRPCGQRALTSVISHSKSHQNTAWQAFLPTGPVAFLPLRDGEDDRHCAIVWSIDLDEVERIENLPDAEFLNLINRYIPAELGVVQSATRRVGFPLQQKLAKSYHAGRVILVGDSAHNIHPLAGQGANLGFADVAELVKQMQRAQTRGETLWSDSVMRRYQRQRRWQNQSMALAMDFFRSGFGIAEPHMRVLRNQAMHQFQRQKKLKKLISSFALHSAG